MRINLFDQSRMLINVVITITTAEKAIVSRILIERSDIRIVVAPSKWKLFWIDVIGRPRSDIVWNAENATMAVDLS